MNEKSPSWVLIALCALAACANDRSGSAASGADDADVTGSNDNEPQLEAVPPAAGEAGATPPGGPAKPIGPGLQRLVDVARQQLAARLRVDPASIETLRAEYVTWRDSSLGCPTPGSAAMQVLTNGALIELRAGGQVYRYHSGQDRPPFYCKTPSPIDPLPYGPGET